MFLNQFSNKLSKASTQNNYYPQIILAVAIALILIYPSLFLFLDYETGQLALTFYVAHVIIGMGLIEIVFPNQASPFSIYFSVLYASGFSLICIFFAVLWTKKHKQGPVEWLMRKVTG